METAKQLSVSLVNKPGRLAAMLNALHKEKVGFRALVVMDSGDRGTIRFIPDNYESAMKVLKQNNISYEMTNVLLVEIPPQPGAFRNICQRLADNHLNIDYAYCSFPQSGKVKAGVMGVFKVNNLAKAQRVLQENGALAHREKLVGRRPIHAR
ncbi:MAG TPA: hypothetical protein PK777_12030 [Thermoguttaceae bacterium]|nr:hypothetical protein [Thermoguttaceae bacterium]